MIFDGVAIQTSQSIAKGRRSQISLLALLASTYALFPTAANAQTATAVASENDAAVDEANNEDVIVVTGVRGGIMRSLDSKRRADSIIDTISSEDIGKFPDRNIAEAIQRIPGVSIDRSGGEGRKVSINGLGPDFSLTLFNGRQIATADRGRSFSFDTIASDLVAGIDVYKTTNADIPEGGLGGTIDVRTALPFNQKQGLTAVVSADYLYQQSTKDGYPGGSIILSNRFMDDRLGLLLSFSHQKRHAQSRQAVVGAWSKTYFIDPVTRAYVEDDRQESWRAWNLQYGTTDTYRERNGGTAAIQFQATDELLFTADYLYSNFKVKEVNNSGGAYLWAMQDTPQSIFDEGSASYTQLDIAGAHPLGSYSFNNSETFRPTVTQVAGFNTKWSPTDDFTAVFDVSWSQAETNNRGLNRSHTLEMLDEPGYLVKFPLGGVPQIDTLGPDLTGAQGELRARLVSNSGTYVLAENTQAKVDLEKRFSDNVKFEFGALLGRQIKQTQFYSTPTAIARMYHKNAEGQVIDTDSIISGIMMADGRFGVDGNPFPVFLIDGDAMRAWMADPANLANRTINASAGGLAQFIENGRTWNAVKTFDSYRVKEDDFSAYAQLVLDGELGSMPYNIVGGMRYSNTEVDSSGTMRILTNLTPESDLNNTLLAEYSSDVPTPVKVKNNYQYFLPSLNVKLEPVDKVILRASVSRTMSRPTLEDMAPAIRYGQLSKNRRTASGGNPNLKPFVSTNFDGSAEYYYSRNGAVMVSGFYKSVDNFIIREVKNEILTSVENPEYQLFEVNRPNNAKSATIKGLTAGWTHAFDFGLGFQANYTLVRSSATQADEQAFAIPGISNTANAVVFYEKGPISARVAYNWRDRFLVQTGLVGNSEPVYADPYQQVDARIGFDLGNDLTIGAEATNITNEKVVSHGSSEVQFVSSYHHGRQFRATISKKF